MKYIDRYLLGAVEEGLSQMAAVALLGPRQSGKSTLAKHYCEHRKDVLYLDLERPFDIRRLEDPESLFAANADKLICIDEIQRMPSLFPVLRYMIDARGRKGQFLLLGSASRDLIEQCSETLAGRIRYLELTPFLYHELEPDMNSYWLRGGFPPSWLAEDDTASYEWRLDLIRSFLERDVPAIKPRVSPLRVEQLWRMVAHLHGQLLNRATLAGALGVDNHTVRNHLDLLEGAFMLRRLMPLHANLKKRLVKSPKIYIRDSGILHALLDIPDHGTLFGHPVRGVSWEGMVIENIASRMHRSVQLSFYRTARGAEIDLVMERGGQRLAVEIKASTAPSVERGFWSGLDDIGVEKAYVIAPVESRFILRKGVEVLPLADFLMEPELVDKWLK